MARSRDALHSQRCDCTSSPLAYSRIKDCVADVHGDARTAAAAKGAVILEAAVAKLIGIVDELRAWPIAEHADMHERPASKEIRW